MKKTKAQRKTQRAITKYIDNLTLEEAREAYTRDQSTINLLVMRAVEAREEAEAISNSQNTMFDEHDCTVIKRPAFQKYFV